MSSTAHRAHPASRFLSRLFSRPKPSALTGDSDAGALFASFATIASDRGLFDRTLASIDDVLVNRNHFPLDTCGGAESIQCVLRSPSIGDRCAPCGDH